MLDAGLPAEDTTPLVLDAALTTLDNEDAQGLFTWISQVEKYLVDTLLYGVLGASLEIRYILLLSLTLILRDP